MTTEAQQDAAFALAEFGESIVYVPRTGGERNIQAIVQREQRDDLGGIDGTLRERTTITVANDSTTGITDTEVDFGTDRVKLSLKVAGLSRRLSILGYSTGERDAGFIGFEVG